MISPLLITAQSTDLHRSTKLIETRVSHPLIHIGAMIKARNALLVEDAKQGPASEDLEEGGLKEVRRPCLSGHLISTLRKHTS